MSRYEVELTDEEAREFAADWTDSADRRDREWAYGRAAYALADAIRANPPKPPRMDEPGWGEKVIASTDGDTQRRPWVRWSTTYAPALNYYCWSDGGQIRPWRDLIDPEPWRADA